MIYEITVFTRALEDFKFVKNGRKVVRILYEKIYNEVDKINL
ncbi:hypothetical protein SAMN02194393_03054 [Maledivibacter halophilus]|uniref:Uncharacterized protein n=1 Tax=Maledivibacter halophilus TaxID=36842 RepID=A0A1T5LLL7_9FIRM|nr:hypothetical protein SAMN02194393_03054 [Maledivibacter halophilus]